MRTPFFGQYGNDIEFQNDSDLLDKFSNIDCSVPSRTQGRKSSHRERYCLKIYLIYLLQNKLLKFPFKIIKEEAPDFFILCHNETIALEVTDAATEDYQRAMTELEKSPLGTILESGTYELVKPGQRLNGPGWNGNSAEIEWVRVILDSIINKIKSLNQPHFKTAGRYELLIYDNSDVSVMLHVKDALPLLKKSIHEKLNTKRFEKTFHLISVIHSSQLLYDVTDKTLS